MYSHVVSRFLFYPACFLKWSTLHRRLWITQFFGQSAQSTENRAEYGRSLENLAMRLLYGRRITGADGKKVETERNSAARFSAIKVKIYRENSAYDRQFTSAFYSLFVRSTFTVEKASCELTTSRFHASILEFFCHETQLCLCLSFALSPPVSSSPIHLRRENSRSNVDFSEWHAPW